MRTAAPATAANILLMDPPNGLQARARDGGRDGECGHEAYPEDHTTDKRYQCLVPANPAGWTSGERSRAAGATPWPPTPAPASWTQARQQPGASAVFRLFPRWSAG